MSDKPFYSPNDYLKLQKENEKLQSNYNEAREELTALSHCYDELEQRLATAVEALDDTKQALEYVLKFGNGGYRNRIDIESLKGQNSMLGSCYNSLVQAQEALNKIKKG